MFVDYLHKLINKNNYMVVTSELSIIRKSSTQPNPPTCQIYPTQPMGQNGSRPMGRNPWLDPWVETHGSKPLKRRAKKDWWVETYLFRGNFFIGPQKGSKKRTHGSTQWVETHGSRPTSWSQSTQPNPTHGSTHGSRLTTLSTSAANYKCSM